MKEVFCDIAVVGAGPAGLAAAAAAQNSGAENVILVEQKAKIPIEAWNRPDGRRKRMSHGVERVLGSFQEVMEKLKGICRMKTTATQLRGKSLLCIDQEGIVKIHFLALILAMGSGAGMREGSLPNTGFYTAAKDPGQLNLPNAHKGAVILGSDDSSMLLARQMVQKGIRVRAIVDSLPNMAGSAENKARCLDRFQIPLYLSHTVIDVLGGNRTESVTLAPVDSERRIQTEKAFVIPCDKLMCSKGRTLYTMDLFLSEIPRGIRVNHLKQTQMPWLFACGDLVQPHEWDHQAAREGTIAGRSAAAYVNQGLSDECKECSGLR